MKFGINNFPLPGGEKWLASIKYIFMNSGIVKFLYEWKCVLLFLDQNDHSLYLLSLFFKY